MQKIFCFVFSFVAWTNAFSNPDDTTGTIKRYHVNRAVVSVLIAGGSVADYLAIKPLRNKSVISESEFNNLNRGEINSMDSWALKQSATDRRKFQQISDYSQIPFYVVPALLGLNKNIRRDWLDLTLMYMEGHTITFFSYNYGFLGPRFQNKFRPLVYYDEIALADRNIGYNRSSFYSGHTASVAYTSFFMAKVFCDYHPDLGYKKYLLYSAAVIPPTVMGYMRVKALAHFPSDCLVGLLVGATIGVAIPEFHKINNKDFSLGMFSSPDGSGVTVHYTFAHAAK